jgi:hypothetical protein
VVIESFRRQLRLYAAGIAEAMGRWPEAARIIAASGQKMDVEVNPEACDAEAEEAVASLEPLESLKQARRQMISRPPAPQAAQAVPSRLPAPLSGAGCAMLKCNPFKIQPGEALYARWKMALMATSTPLRSRLYLPVFLWLADNR